MRLLIAVLLVIAPCAWTQEPGAYSYRANGHAFFTGGACQHGYAHYGGGFGGEGFVWRGLALGGELGVLKFNDRNSDPIGLTAFHVGYHFVDRKRPVKVDPYFNAALLGIGFTGRGNSAYGGLGGGVNYWFKPRFGLRMEGRLNALGEGEALFMVRMGVVFR
jgi:hypothetical protein